MTIVFPPLLRECFCREKVVVLCVGRADAEGTIVGGC